MALQALDTALITLQDIWDYNSRIDPGDADIFLEGLILQCSGAISTFCSRKFAQTTHTEIHNGNGKETLILRHMPITTPLSTVTDGGIYLDSNRVFATALTEWSSSTGDYVVKSDGQEEGGGYIYRVNGVFSKGIQNLKIVYQAGYTTIPDPVKLACLRYVTYLFQLVQQGLNAATMITTAGTMITGVQHRAMPDDVRDMLKPWKRYIIR